MEIIGREPRQEIDSDPGPDPDFDSCLVAGKACFRGKFVLGYETACSG